MKIRTAPGCIAVAVAVVSATFLSSCSDPSADATNNSSEVVEDENLASLLPERIQEAGVMTIAAGYTHPPVIFSTDSGQPTGIMYDLGESIAKKLGVDTEWKEVAFAGIIPGVQTGKFDISMGILADTPERQEILDFVDVLSSDATLLVKQGNPSNMTTVAEGCGKSIGALSGATFLLTVADASRDCVAAGEPEITIKEYADFPAGQAQLLSGRLDAYISPAVVMKRVADVADGGQLFDVTDERIPNDPFAVTLRKGDGDMAEAIHGALHALVEDGTYEEILEKYDAAEFALTPEQIAINGAGTDVFN